MSIAYIPTSRITDGLDLASPPTQKKISNDQKIITTYGLIDPLENCSVCRTVIKTNEWAKKLPCKHTFHTNCITPWLEIRPNCPNCRFNVAIPRSQQQVPANVVAFAVILPRGDGLIELEIPHDVYNRLTPSFELLLMAIGDGNVDDVRQLFQSGILPIGEYGGHSVGNVGVPFAAEHGRTACLEELLEHVQISEQIRGMAAVKAAEGGHTDCIRLLIANGFISEDFQNQTIEQARRLGYEDIVELFIPAPEAQLNINLQNPSSWNPLAVCLLAIAAVGTFYFMQD